MLAHAIDADIHLRERVLAFLNRHCTLNLATEGPLGLWSAAVWYVHDGFDLYFTSDPATRHARNMLATGLVAGTINDDSDSFQLMQGLQLDGKLDRVTRTADLQPIVASYLKRFPGARMLWNGESDPAVIARDPGHHWFFRVRPSHLRYMDNIYAPGRRDELVLT
jgi:uncharacterized protein